MSAVDVELAAPRAGWMAVRLRVGADEWQGIASHLFDCVTDLVCAALELTESREARPVTFYEEPGVYRLAMTGSGDIVQVTLTKHWSIKPTPNAHNGTIVFSTAVQRSTLMRAILAGLRQLDVACGHPHFDAAWREPFPAKELAQLAVRIAQPA